VVGPEFSPSVVGDQIAPLCRAKIEDRDYAAPFFPRTPVTERRAKLRKVVSTSSLAPALEEKKVRGAFYTPPKLAEALANWAIKSARDRVLDPAAGEAIFLSAAIQRLNALGAQGAAGQVVGIEIDSNARQKALSVMSSNGCDCEVILSDFFNVDLKDFRASFEAVIGNPPYVRYHRFRGDARKRGLEAAAAAGVGLNRLTSSWAPFLVHATQFVAPGGRLAMVLPAELLQVDYAEPIRKFLLRRFSTVTVITFETAVFPGASIDTVLLLAEDGPARLGLRIITLQDPSDLETSFEGEFSDHPVTRWSRLRAPVAGVKALERLRQANKLLPLSAVASVDIGSVTGANNFFILTMQKARELGLKSSALRPLITRPAQLPGAILTPEDKQSITNNERSLVMMISRPGLEKGTSPLARYLRRGRRLGINKRYKCQVRSPWYSVPGVRIPDAFLSYMSYWAPRLSLNTAGFSSTNLVHQVTFASDFRPLAAAYIAALHSTLSLLSFELEGRSYGGGVLKLETQEAERAEIPALDAALAKLLADSLPDIDRHIRDGQPEKAVDLVDRALLDHGVLDEGSLNEIRSSHRSLQERRMLRGRTSSQ
jgi:adenine-specific DNA-methyltransferase